MYEDGATPADRKKRRWATTISNLTIPPIIAVLTFALINYTVSSGPSFVALTLLTTLLAMAVPLGVILILRRRTDAHDIDIPIREERGRPLLLSAASYFVGTLVLSLVQAPSLITGVAFAYGIGTFVIFLINLRWKISIHTMELLGQPLYSSLSLACGVCCLERSCHPSYGVGCTWRNIRSPRLSLG